MGAAQARTGFFLQLQKGLHPAATGALNCSCEQVVFCLGLRLLGSHTTFWE